MMPGRKGLLMKHMSFISLALVLVVFLAACGSPPRRAAPAALPGQPAPGTPNPTLPVLQPATGSGIGVTVLPPGGTVGWGPVTTPFVVTVRPEAFFTPTYGSTFTPMVKNREPMNTPDPRTPLPDHDPRVTPSRLITPYYIPPVYVTYVTPTPLGTPLGTPIPSPTRNLPGTPSP